MVSLANLFHRTVWNSFGSADFHRKPKQTIRESEFGAGSRSNKLAVSISTTKQCGSITRLIAGERPTSRDSGQT